MSSAAEGRVEIAVAVVECEGQFLIGLRPVGGPLAGYWEFPGGKVHAGESPAEAAVRECREETGLEVVARESYTAVSHDYKHGQLRLHFFACELVTQQTELLPERFRWVPASQLGAYKFPPANEALISELQARRS